MRKIFLDIGGWNGASVEFFLKYHPEAKEFEIYTFECDRKNIIILNNRHLPINLIKKAAWSSDGVVRFYPGGNMPQSGGTLYKEKTTGKVNPNRFYEVESIDLAKFIKNNFTKESYIICKMNCEGAEYELIPHLKKNNLIEWIDKWYVQWHYDKIKMNEEEHLSVVRMLPDYNEWDCQCNEKVFKNVFLKSL
jgi:FkbM family methyltransferase